MFVIFMVINRTFDPRLAAAAAASHPAVTGAYDNNIIFGKLIHVPRETFVHKQPAKIRNAH